MAMWRHLVERSSKALLLCVDDTKFHLSRAVKKQNSRYYSEENTRELHHQPLHIPKLNKWCAIPNVGVGVPYFLENVEVSAEAVTSDHYRIMPQSFLQIRLQEMYAFCRTAQLRTHLTFWRQLCEDCSRARHLIVWWQRLATIFGGFISVRFFSLGDTWQHECTNIEHKLGKHWKRQ